MMNWSAILENEDRLFLKALLSILLERDASPTGYEHLKRGFTSDQEDLQRNSLFSEKFISRSLVNARVLRRRIGERTWQV
jgi:hypothetical protein